jgi:hypothetical protein
VRGHPARRPRLRHAGLPAEDRLRPGRQSPASPEAKGAHIYGASGIPAVSCRLRSCRHEEAMSR